MTSSNKNGVPDEPLNLVDCGLDDLVTALLAGHPIATEPGGSLFSLDNDNSRRIFSYYAQHRELWPQRKMVQAREIEDVLRALEQPPPPKTRTTTAAVTVPRSWTLRRVEAHRFGGLHKHCGSRGEDPDDFALDIEDDVTLISGFNGAGKTALQNVIIWCLTGQALRSQHMPDEVHEPMDVNRITSEEPDEEQPDARTFALPPIVPIPTGENLDVLQEQPAVDTWAQLTFQDQASTNTCVIRRELTVSPRGKISMAVTGLDDLGLSELAIEAGTLMPGVASHMRFDEKTTFAQAIAQLTGLKPLEDLGKRCVRVVKRLRGDETDKSQTKANETLAEFKSKRQTLREAWSAQADLGDPADIVAPDEESEDGESKSSIEESQKILERRKQRLESTAETILGQPLQLVSQQEVDGMLVQLETATDLLKPAALKGLPSVSVIKNLQAVTDTDCRDAEALIAEITDRAQLVSERLRNKQEAARWQLYASVATWHAEHHQGTDIVNCPVCGTDLEKVPADALVDKAVKEALRLCSEADADAAKGAEQWERDAAREFLDMVPESLRVFSEKAPPIELISIYHKAYVEELLTDATFGDRLRPLKKNALEVWEIAKRDNVFPVALDARAIEWPDEFSNGTLANRVENIVAAITLSRNRAAATETIKLVVERYIGKPTQAKQWAAEIDDEAVTADSLPLYHQIEALRMCVDSTAPIVSILRQLGELNGTRNEYLAVEKRLRRLEQAAAAVVAFSGFETLVFKQVSGLIKILDTGTTDWLSSIYRPHYTGGPSYSGFDATEEKGLGLRAGIGGMQVPASEIMNASLLRACVWAFLFSLWERIRSVMGGIDCVLLDDPQTHLDPINAEHFAAVIPQMPARGMRPIITSNDYRFLAAIRDTLPNQSIEYPSWSAWFINPISSSRLTANLSPDVEQIFEYLKAWEADENNASKAQVLVGAVRLYIENRLWDLLAADPMVMHKPTLSDLINALRSARNGGERPFAEPPFHALLTNLSLKDTAPFYGIINKAHHRLVEVTPFDARIVADSFSGIDRQLRSCAASYARFMGRLTREDRDLFFAEGPPAPKRAEIGEKQIPIVGEVSARSNSNMLAATQAELFFDFGGLGDVALYGVRCPSLSPLALPGQIVVASLENEAMDGDPVVALHEEKIFVRRLLGDRRDPSRVVLASDQASTENVPPTLMVPKTKTALLPIVGVLYDHQSFQGKQEAHLVDGCTLLERDIVGAKVADDSAYPVIRSGDTILLEAVNYLDADEIARLEDRVVVVQAGDSSGSYAYLKRLGGEVSPGTRILENVGIKGNALAVTFESNETQSGVLHVQSIWRVHGTLRSPQ